MIVLVAGLAMLINYHVYYQLIPIPSVDACASRHPPQHNPPLTTWILQAPF